MNPFRLLDAIPEKLQAPIGIAAALSVIFTAGALLEKYEPSAPPASSAATSFRDKDVPSARAPPSFRDKDVPSARVPHGHDGAYVLACQSVDQYRQLAPIFTLGNGPPVVRAISMKECYQINDRAEYASAMQPHHFYRVASIEAGLACVWALASPGGCYWTREDNLHHIGRGPQLSEDQFRDARALYARARELRDLELGYSRQAIDLKNWQGDRREEARLRALAKNADDQALAIEDRIAQFQPTEPPPMETSATRPAVDGGLGIGPEQLKGWGDE